MLTFRILCPYFIYLLLLLLLVTFLLSFRNESKLIMIEFTNNSLMRDTIECLFEGVNISKDDYHSN